MNTAVVPSTNLVVMYVVNAVVVMDVISGFVVATLLCVVVLFDDS